MVKKSRILVISIISIIVCIALVSTILASRSLRHPSVTFGHGGDEITTTYMSSTRDLDAVISDVLDRVAKLPTQSPVAPATSSQQQGTTPATTPTTSTSTATLDLITTISGSCPDGYSWIANVHSGTAASFSAYQSQSSAVNAWLSVCVKSSDTQTKNIISYMSAKICSWGQVDGSCPADYTAIGQAIVRSDESGGCKRIQSTLQSSTKLPNGDLNTVNGGSLLFCQKGSPEYYISPGSCNSGDKLLGIVGEGNYNFCRTADGSASATSTGTSSSSSLSILSSSTYCDYIPADVRSNYGYYDDAGTQVQCP